VWVEELTPDEFRLYVEWCLRGGGREISVHVLTYDGDFVRDVSDLLMDGGEITGDTTRDIVQIATITLADPGRTVSFEHPTGNVPVSRRRLIQIIDSRQVPGLGWVDCVIHTGPIWTPTRDGDTVRLVIHDGARLAMGTVRKRESWSRKTRITSVLVDLLSAAGASADQIQVPRLRPTLAKVVHVGHRPKKKHGGKKGEKKQRHRVHRFVADTDDTYWSEAQLLARALGRRLYATPTLTFRLKRLSNRPALILDRGDLLAPPSIGRPDEDGPRPNVFEVQGRDPKGKKHHRPSAAAVLPEAHEDSRESLKWHGKPTENRQITTDDHAKSKPGCKKRAVQLRDRALRVPQQREVVIPAMPFLQPWDLINVREVGVVARDQWRTPLSGAEGETIGSTKRVRANYRGRRRG
jgi:hypothetical protein